MTLIDLDDVPMACMICGEMRRAKDLDVVHRALPGMEDAFPHARSNISYCADRPACAEAAEHGPPFGATLPPPP